jgi:hypothetical protein
MVHEKSIVPSIPNLGIRGRKTAILTPVKTQVFSIGQEAGWPPVTLQT